ncbi:GOLPH3/VPS74 family protein [Nocardioides jejuensis]|nr:GPP34 family phosphoprotein [Nocardioides jejuensis]
MTTTTDLALIALDPTTGKRRLGTYGEIVLGGAALKDLLLAGRLSVAGEGKKALVSVADPTPTGIAHLDAALARLTSRTKPLKSRDAVTRLGRKLPITTYEALVADGLVEAHPTTVLGLFPSPRYVALPQARRDELVAGVRAVLLGERAPDERLGTLGALLGAGRQVKLVVPKERRKEAEKRAKTLADGDWASEAVRAAVKASEDAMMIAVLAATTTAGAGAAS